MAMDMTTFEYSTPFIVCGVLTMLTILPGNLLPLQMMKGQRGSTNGVAAFCHAHIMAWGLQVGVSNGDQYDCFQVILILALKLASWAPYSILQLLVAMASTYWVLNMLMINLSTIAITPRFAPNPTPLGLAGFFVFMPCLEASTVIMRAVLFIPKGQWVILAIWFGVCVIFMSKVAVRIDRLGRHPTFIYMQEAAAFRAKHVEAGNGWQQGADDPDNFDLLKVSSKAIDHMKERLADKDMAKESSDSELLSKSDFTSADGLNRMMQAFLESETVSMSVWLPTYFAVVLMWTAAPFIAATINPAQFSV